MDPPQKAPSSPLQESRGGKDKVRLFYNDQTVTSFVNSFEVIKDKEYEYLDMDYIEEVTDEVYSFIKRSSREEVYKLETEFDKKHPFNHRKIPQMDLDAFEKVKQDAMMNDAQHSEF